MPWAAPLWGSALGSGVSGASRGNLHTLHSGTGDCPAHKMALALSHTPLAQMCHETFPLKVAPHKVTGGLQVPSGTMYGGSISFRSRDVVSGID